MKFCFMYKGYAIECWCQNQAHCYSSTPNTAAAENKILVAHELEQMIEQPELDLLQYLGEGLYLV
jgi:hypothetical protein